MSLNLAVDTATAMGSVAVGEPGSLQAEIIVGPRRHATSLVPAIGEVLRLADADYGDLSGIVVADGPGSFTGLRIAFATVKGLLMEYDHLTLSIAPSLLAAAWSALQIDPAPVAALYDALRGEVFGGVYSLTGGEIRVELPPTLATVEALEIRTPVRPWLAVGDGAASHAEAVQKWTGRRPVGPPTGAPRAGALLELLAVGKATKCVADPASFEPNYGRQAEAQVRWEREHGVSLGAGREHQRDPEFKPKQGSQ